MHPKFGPKISEFEVQNLRTVICTNNKRVTHYFIHYVEWFITMIFLDDFILFFRVNCIHWNTNSL